MIVGNYQIGYGQGLLLHTGFGSNKSGEAMYVMRTSNTGLKPHQAFYNYGFTGIGTTLFWKAWEQSFYYAYNEIDGKVEEEAGGNQYVKSIQRSDSHRTIAEINKKAQVNEQLIGVRGSPERDILSLGAMGLGLGRFPALFAWRRVRVLCLFEKMLTVQTFWHLFCKNAGSASFLHVFPKVFSRKALLDRCWSSQELILEALWD